MNPMKTYTITTGIPIIMRTEYKADNTMSMKQTILASAKTEFSNKGFKDASVRAIARQAGTAAGNVYNYFESKDDLFCKLLQPLIDALDAFFRAHNSEQNLSIDIFSAPSSQFDTMNNIFGLTEKYTDELKLLWFHSEGSSLARFKDTLVERQTETGMEYLRLMHDRYPHLNTDISPFFLHLSSSFWVALVGEMIRNTGFTREEKQQAFDDYIRFGIAGWKELMQVEKMKNEE